MGLLWLHRPLPSPLCQLSGKRNSSVFCLLGSRALVNSLFFPLGQTHPGLLGILNGGGRGGCPRHPNRGGTWHLFFSRAGRESSVPELPLNERQWLWGGAGGARDTLAGLSSVRRPAACFSSAAVVAVSPHLIPASARVLVNFLYLFT